MLAGLIHLGACRAAAAFRARACSPGGWPELLGQAIDRTGDTAILIFLVLVGCAALVLCAFVLWPLSVAVMLGLGVRICQELLGREKS